MAEHQRGKLLQDIKRLENAKAMLQGYIAQDEKYIAQFRAELALPDTTSNRRALLEGRVRRCESEIQSWKLQISDADRELAPLQRAALDQLDAVLGPTPSSSSRPATSPTSDKEYQNIRDSAMKDGVVKLQISDVVWMGVAGSGKTTSLARAMDEPLPEERNSTPCAKAPIRAVVQTKIGVDKEEKLERMEENRFFDSFSYTVMKEGQKLVKSHKSLPISKTIAPKYIRKLEEEMVRQVHETTHPLLYDFRWSRLTDSGGQPQFLEMLPKFLHHISLGIFTIKLNERLDHHPMIEYYGEDGKLVGEPYESRFSNEQTIRYCMRALVSQGEDKGDFKFLFLGTHLDLVDQCEGESLKDKNLKLKKIIRSFNMNRHVIYRNYQKDPLFAINAKKPSSDDWEVIKQLRKVIVESSKVQPSIPIPIRWFAMELALLRHMKETKQAVLTEEACFKMVAHYYHGQADFKAALKYLHQAKLIFHFEKRGLVVADMQMLLDKLSQLVRYNIELETRHAMDGIWIEFCRHGILNVKCLDKFPDGYIDGVFSPTDLLELFAHLCIMSELRANEFLMPCLLRVDGLCQPQPETHAVPALAVEFPQGGPMLGSFCRLICYLINTAKWELEEDEFGELCQLSRNSICFSAPEGLPGAVTISDPFSSFFVLSFDGPLEVASEACPLIQETILAGIQDISKSHHHLSQEAASATDAQNNIPEFAFICWCGKTPLHAATFSSRSRYLRCTFNSKIFKEVTTQHNVWFKGGALPCPSPGPVSHDSPATYTSSTVSGHVTSDPATPASAAPSPSLSTLSLLKWKDQQGCVHRFRLVNSVSARWTEFGYLLDLTPTQLSGWRTQHAGDASACWMEVMQRWLDNESSQYVATWEGLYDLLEDVGYPTWVSELKNAVHCSSKNTTS